MCCCGVLMYLFFLNDFYFKYQSLFPHPPLLLFPLPSTPHSPAILQRVRPLIGSQQSLSDHLRQDQDPLPCIRLSTSLSFKGIISQSLPNFCERINVICHNQKLVNCYGWGEMLCSTAQAQKMDLTGKVDSVLQL